MEELGLREVCWLQPTVKRKRTKRKTNFPKYIYRCKINQNTGNLQDQSSWPFGIWAMAFTAVCCSAIEKSQSSRSINWNFFLSKFYRCSCFLEMFCIGQLKAILILHILVCGISLFLFIPDIKVHNDLNLFS